jgi:hypothetical protein
MTARWSRRDLLKSLGVGVPAVALPVLRSSPLRAATPPVRLAVLFKANGTIIESFKPSGSGTSWTIPTGGILEPLMKWKPKLNVIWGVNYDSGDRFFNAAGHQKGPPACLTGGGPVAGSMRGGNGTASGYGNHISVDQYVANKWGPVTRLKTLELGVAIRGASNRNRISYLGPNQPVPPEPDPAAAFSRVFAGFTPAGAGGDPGAGAAVMRLLARRKSVLDYVTADLARLSARLPGDERVRLDRHLESIHDLERQLAPGAAAGGGMACKPAAPVSDGAYPKVSQLQMDVMFNALACDQTRLVTYIWNGETSQQTFPFIGVNDAHHDMSHKPDSDAGTRDKLIKVNRWYASQVAYFLEKMDSVVEGPDGKTMLDNSLVIWTDGLGKGNNHTRKNIPWVLAGSARGYLPTGRYHDYGDKPHNHLLVNILHALGLPEERQFGPIKEWTGPLPGLAPSSG